jgi:hypothetical protein
LLTWNETLVSTTSAFGKKVWTGGVNTAERLEYNDFFSFDLEIGSGSVDGSAPGSVVDSGSGSLDGSGSGSVTVLS